MRNSWKYYGKGKVCNHEQSWEIEKGTPEDWEIFKAILQGNSLNGFFDYCDKCEKIHVFKLIGHDEFDK